MGNKDLIIFTNEFPFGKRETFLESEIVVLSKYFENVVIIPSKKLSTVRPLPANVVVNSIVADSYGKAFYWIFRSIFSINFYKQIYKCKHLVFGKNVKELFKYLVSYTIHSNLLPLILDKHKPKKIYSYWFVSVVDVLSGLKEKYDFKLFTRAHRVDLYEEYNPLKFFPNREESIRKLDVLFSISEHGKGYLQERYNFEKVILSRLGVIAQNKISKKSAPGNLSIASVSNLIPVKRVKLIAQSIINLCSENIELNVVWNHFGDGEQRAEILALLNEYNGENLKYNFHGMVSNIDIFNFYRNNPVDCIINLSESEGIPVSMMEAISFGIPIVATNVGGVHEIVNSDTGILLSSSPDISDVVSSVLQVLAADFDREKIIDFCNRNYNAENNYSDFSQMLLTR